MWKFREFSIIQILSEINFGECRSSKNAIFAILGALNFVSFVKFGSSKIDNIQSLKMCYIDRFWDSSRFANFDFT